MAQFIEYQLSGTAAPLNYVPAVTVTAGNPPTLNYAVTSGIGITLPDDYNGAISVQVIAIGGTTPVLLLEASNRDPFYSIATPAGTYGLSNTSLGQQVLFSDTTSNWQPLQITNASTGTAIAGSTGMTAVGLYVAQALAYRNIRVRLSSGTTPTATVILGYGYLL